MNRTMTKLANFPPDLAVANTCGTAENPRAVNHANDDAESTGRHTSQQVVV